MTGPDSRQHYGVTLAVLVTGALAYALSQTLVAPALPDIQRELHTSTTAVTYVLTAYLLSASIATPILGRLGDMFGKERVLVATLSVFAVGSLVAALSHSIEMLIAGRAIQGAAGAVFPLSFGIIRDEFPPERVSSSIGLISATAGIGGGLGLILGGLILDNASYHWIFWLGAAMALLAAIATMLFVHESPTRIPARVDVRGAIVLAIGLSIPMYAISQANAWGWTSAKMIGLTVAGLLILAFWVWLESRTEDPLADVSLLAKPAVAMTNLATMLVGFGMFGSFILIPQLVEAPEVTGYGFGLTATQAGLVMLPGALTMLFAGPLSGSLGSRFGNRLPMVLGCLISGIGLLGLGLDHGSTLSVVLWNVFGSIGIGLAFAAMPNLIMEAVPLEQTGEATGINALIRSVGSSLGSQVTASILTATIVASTSLPTGDGFTTAFLAAAGMSIVAGFVAMLIPASGKSHLPVGEEIGAASILPDPAQAPDR